MVSLYGRLFKYRERPNRAPLEDFLTEALADFINRLTAETQAHFLGELFVPVFLRSDWVQLHENCTCRAETQFRIDEENIADLVILANGKPVIIIENKVSAPIRRSGEVDQLSQYGNWLKKQCNSGWPGVICMLTHITPPPLDFAETNPSKYGALPHVTRWREIASLLRKPRVAGSINWPTAAHQNEFILRDEFVSFLMESGMSEEFADLEDFSAAIVYLRSNAKMEHTFNSISQHIRKYGLMFVGGSKHDCSLWHDSNPGLIWGWIVLAGNLKDVFFGFGISLRPSVHFKSKGIPDVDSAFLCLGSQHKREMEQIQSIVSDMKLNWPLVTIDDYRAAFVFRPLSEMLSAPQDFSKNMNVWIDTIQPTVEQVVKKLEKVKVK